jgi:predicted nucleotidyltransferase
MFGRVDAILHTLTLQPLASDDNDAVMMALLSRHVWDPAGFVAANWQALSAFLQVKDVLHYHWVRAKGNWDHFLRQPRVLARKYLYTLHELFVLMWVLGEGSAPPIHFWTLADRFVKSLAVKEEIMRVYGINQKAKSKADTEMDRSDGLNAYVEGAIAQLEDAVATHHADAAALVFGPVETE